MKNQNLLLAIGISFSSLLSTHALADNLTLQNAFTKLAPTAQNIILVADKVHITASSPAYKKEVQSKLNSESYIHDYVTNGIPLVSDKNYDWAFIPLKIYLADTGGNKGPYLGELQFTVHSNPNDENGVISDVNYSATGASTQYHFTKLPSMTMTNYPNFKITGQLTQGDVAAPIITNAGWSNGLGNSEATFVPNTCYWMQDYGMNEANRWTVDTKNKAISQSTDNLSGNVGSRAYPATVDSNGKFLPCNADAKTGVWQIAVKIGSTGAGAFSETFYLAERHNFMPGPHQYMDGSAHATGGTGREIDVLETRWKPNGPQVNLPNGDNTSWNPQALHGVQMGNWKDVGGAPTPGFVTFGVYINSHNVMWIYAYKPDGSLWYSTDAIPLDNPSYKQTGPFVPYIGTWSTMHNAGGFSTEYKNFVYVPADKIGDLNPKNDPAGFLAKVLKAH